MSVIRPRPPTDPIMYRPPETWPGDDAGESWGRYREWVERSDRARPELAAIASAATGILESYGTIRAHARRRESPLFKLLEVARRLRDSVDRVVVVGDRPDRAVVDLLLATCCHPFHPLLSRSDRGGRPRMLSLGAADDDDRVQGALDLLASRCGDRLSDAWGLVVAGPAREPRTVRLAALLAASEKGKTGAPTRAAIVAGIVAGPQAPASLPLGPDPHPIELPGEGGAGGACFTALLPAAVAGIDVVRVLEGMAAMERRIAEAALEANPVVTLVAVGRTLAAPGEAARRPIHAPPHWPGLADWAASLGPRQGGMPLAPDPGTAIVVSTCRRRPFGPEVSPSPPAAAIGLDAIVLPLADEHTVGQLLSLLRLAAALDGRTG